MAGNVVTVPTGSNAATVQVLDMNGSDITGSCVITATSSDSTVIQIGNPDPTTPNIIPFTALTGGGTATITYDASNASGQVSQTDSITVAVVAPGSMVVVYSASIPTKHKK
jgi:hypothetical protein